MEQANRFGLDLHVHDIKQLRKPRNNNHFRVNITIKNKTHIEAINIIQDYMRMASQSDNNLKFASTAKSGDRKQYQNSYQNIEITDFDTDF
jgi:hypothetical protein